MSAKPICIGLVLPHSYAYYRGVLRGIRRYVEARPQWLLTSIASKQQSLRTLGRLRPAGLIAAVTTRQLVRTLPAWRRPVVNIAAVFQGLRFPRVGVDNDQVGRLAAAHFLERGVRHFGFVGSADYLLSSERGAAFCQALREAGHAVACHEAPAHLVYEPLGQRWARDAGVRRWLRGLPKPVGVFVPRSLGGGDGRSVPASGAACAGGYRPVGRRR